MCPSIVCPACDSKSYHKGTCERCDFDPASAHLDPPDDLERVIVPDTVSVSITRKAKGYPFTFIRLDSENRDHIQELAARLGYKGPIWHSLNPDFFGPEELWGIDIVKHHADPYMDWASREAERVGRD